MTPGEIAEDITLPTSLSQEFYNREYYGTVKHNARAVYQGYLGWYDGNPAHLDPLPDPQRATAYVDLAGGSNNVLLKAQKAFDEGNYRWAAELLNHLVSVEPKNIVARELLARSYDQLGYQAESGPWRDVYLTGALELRQGTSNTSVNLAATKDLLLQTPVSNFFDTLAVRLKSEDAANKDTKIVINFTDLNESHLLWIENSVLHHRLVDDSKPVEEKVNATLNLPHAMFVDLLVGETDFKGMLLSKESKVDNPLGLIGFFRLFEKPNSSFGIVLPDE